MDDIQVKAHEVDDKLVVSYHSDAEPILEAAAAARREHMEAGRFAKTGDLRRTMTVPITEVMKIMQTTGLDFFNPLDAKKILKILKGAEYTKFRTVNGRI